VNFTFS